jgi:deoxyribodipyrimidine photolyase-related protein
MKLQDSITKGSASNLASAARSKSLFIVGSHQLYPLKCLAEYQNDLFLMVEDRAFGSPFKCHKQKLVFQLSSMRHYARELRQHDFDVVYFELRETQSYSYETLLDKVLKQSQLTRITCFEFEDRTRENQLHQFCEENKIEINILPSPAFLVSRADFKEFLEQERRPLPSSFYESQRRRLKILMEPDGKPVGGAYSFHDEQRLRWSQKVPTPKFPVPVHDEIDKAVIKVVDQEFADHPGEAMTLWYPTTRDSATEALNDFCKYRLPQYGPYDEALSASEDFLFHSVLSALLNVGLLLESDVLNTVMKYSDEASVPLNSLESFIHKVFGCREYMRGMYYNFGGELMVNNFWKNHRLMNHSWYVGTTGVPPLDDAIKKAVRLAYNHHVERLAVLANMMTLSEIEPTLCFKWFMEMEMDSAEWVTAPNVFGLGLHSDGGMLGTKPHLLGSHNLLKLSDYVRDDWCLEVDGLYWRFIDKHQDYFSSLAGASSAAENVEKIPAERREVLARAADAFLARNTRYP